MMDSKTLYVMIVIAAVGALSWLIRALPFLLFGRQGEPPKTIAYVGRVLSPAAIAMLVVYCYFAYFKARPFSAASGWNLPEAAAGLLVIWLHLWKRNALLSIIAGVILYMFLVQKIFS